jgi:polyisoprenoid-binding protein YceI
MTFSLVTQELSKIAVGDFAIDPEHSSVRFRTRHLFGLGRVRGDFEVGRGAIHVANPLSGSTVQASILAATFHTGNSARDSMVRSPRMLNTAEHPVIVFASSGVDHTDQRWVVHGSLSVCGISQPFDLDVRTVETTPSGLRVIATTRIDRYAFGLTKSKGLASRYLDIQLDVVSGRV